jgi:arylsulfatase A-like enzyme
MQRRPNLLFVFSDQHRADAVGYAGNPDVRTPNLDRFAESGLDFRNAVSTDPVCSPARASLLTGQYPLTHGVIVNEVGIQSDPVGMGDALRNAGYSTGYIGKWHIDGGRWTGFIPPERRLGFEYWRACECTHDYNHSVYHGDEPTNRVWEGYDVFCQTDDAGDFIRGRKRAGLPFALLLSYGPPHDPYHSAPERFKAMYDPDQLTPRPNVPPEAEVRTRQDLAGYYAHISAIDEAFGALVREIEQCGALEDTVIVYTSDHGDMLGSHGMRTKEKPWDESVRVPLLLSYPTRFGSRGRTIEQPLGTPDIMPTLLGLCGVEIPETVEGVDVFARIDEAPDPESDGALIECIHPFGSWGKIHGGREYRGLRTARYTYVEDREGPWLLYDNARDPYQLENLLGRETYVGTQQRLAAALAGHLREAGDRFERGEAYMDRYGYTYDETGRVPIVK